MKPVPIKVLIVDDDEAVLIALEQLLEGEGYQTVTAWSGRDALRLSSDQRFDLLLVDEHLSDMDTGVLLEDLARVQPGAFRFLMFTRKDSAKKPSSTTCVAVCKWEHGDMKAKIQSSMAA